MMTTMMTIPTMTMTPIVNLLNMKVPKQVHSQKKSRLVVMISLQQQRLIRRMKVVVVFRLVPRAKNKTKIIKKVVQ